MIVTFRQESAAFVQRVEPFLLAHEAEHNLLFSILNAARRAPAGQATPLLMASVEQEGKVVGVALRAEPHFLVLSRGVAGEAALALARALGERGAALPGVLGPTDGARAFAEAWQQATGHAFEVERLQRVYQLERVAPLPTVAGHLRPATPADRARLVRWAEAFVQEAMGGNEPGFHAERTVDGYLQRGGLYLWEDGEPVTMAVAQGPTPHGIRISFVYTPPERRRHGYASACVAALSQRLLDEGRRFCFLFTDLANPTSNHIYQTIGYHPVAEMTSYRFR